MFELSFEINGKKVSPDSIGDAIEAAGLQVFRDSILEKNTHISKNCKRIVCH